MCLTAMLNLTRGTAIVRHGRPVSGKGANRTQLGQRFTKPPELQN